MMGESLKTINAKTRFWTLFCQAALVLTPFLLLGVLSLLMQKNAFAAYPLWTDELDYWRSLYNWDHVGFASGYSGILEATPAAGSLSVHGLTPILLYGWFVKLFGLGPHTILWANATWLSLGALVFCRLRKPKPLCSLWLTGLTLSYVPVVLYVFSSMTEIFNYGLLFFYLAFLLSYRESRRPWLLVLCCLATAWACFYRINLFLLLFPVGWAFGGERICKKTLLFWLAALVAAAGLYWTASRYTAPYVQGFLHNLMGAGQWSTALQMLLSHAKINLMNYFTFYKVDPVQFTFRLLYLLAGVLCLVAAFVRMERKGKKLSLRLGTDLSYLWGFLWLFCSLTIVIFLYEVMDWADFRTLAPILWLVPVFLFARGKRGIPTVLLAGSLALCAVFCLQEPVGVFADSGRFSPPEKNEQFAIVQGYVHYDEEAEDPFQNSLRLDIDTRLVTELAPGIGLEYGWFSPETIGKSKWLLTDYLKLALEGYQPVYVSYGMELYQRMEDPKEE